MTPLTVEDVVAILRRRQAQAHTEADGFCVDGFTQSATHFRIQAHALQDAIRAIRRVQRKRQQEGTTP